MRWLRRCLCWLGFFPKPTSESVEAGVLSPVHVLLDQVGEHPDVGLRRRWKEDCRSYRLRLQIYCQEEIIRREKYEEFLSLLLETERT